MLSTTFEFFTVVSVLGCFVLVQSDFTSLRVTWGPSVFSPRAFAKLPNTEIEARSDGFAKLNDECSGGKFLGSRYLKRSDPAVVLIFDVNGYISGIQNGIPKNDVEKVNTSFSFEKSSAYQLDKILGEKEVYFLTAYFVDPSVICNGTANVTFEERGIGTGLYLQNGSDPIRDTEEVPMYEIFMEGSQWVKGKFFNSMGVHYWYESYEDLKCADFFPVGVIYNNGQLTSFAFASFGNYEFSKRFEHPTAAALSMFFADPVPKCLYDEYERSGGFSSMHVFFSEKPWDIIC